MDGADRSDLGMHAIRDALEALVEPADAARMLFEALDEPDAAVAGDAAGALEFARGPLARVVSNRAGYEVVRQLLATLEAAFEAGGVSESAAWLDPDTVTRTVDPAGGPVRVMVVAKSNRLAQQLDLALGPARVAAGVASDLVAVSQLSGALAPDVFIVDGQNSPDIAGPELAATLAEIIGSPLILVWASDQPWGSAVMTSLDEHGVEHVAVPREEGVAPLMDYLRSRAGD